MGMGVRDEEVLLTVKRIDFLACSQVGRRYDQHNRCSEVLVLC